jgi:hypothetical protein
MAKDDADGSQFDPRFDPAFQPGYDPDRTPAQAAPRRSPERQFPQQVDAYASSQIQAPPQGTADPGAVAVIGAVSVSGPAVASSSTTDQPTRRRVSNPLTIALWILSAVFVAAGISGLRLIGDRVTRLGANGGFGGADYYLLQSYTVGAPMLIVLGLATATGTLFLYAARWKKPE